MRKLLWLPMLTVALLQGCTNEVDGDPIPGDSDGGGDSTPRCCDGAGTCCALPTGDVCVAEGQACPVVCRDGATVCDATARCNDDGVTVTGCVAACPSERACGEIGCCVAGLGCAAGSCEASDLTFDAAAPPSFVVEHRELMDDACEVRSECAGGSGSRHLARLTARIKNVGAAPFFLGPRDSAAVFTSGTCDTAKALPGFVGWRLFKGSTTFASGALDVYCLAAGDGFDCALQGIGPGASASATLGSTCDFVDVSAAPLGSTLELTLNPGGLVVETDTSNNTVRIPVDHCDGVSCGGTCCPEGKCVSNTCRLPDLFVDQPALVDSITIGESQFATNDCALQEGCVDGDGTRRLLRFAVLTPNVGNADLFFGDPTNHPNMIFAACHGHHHFDGYASYRLRDEDGHILAHGHKQAFCLQDSQPVRADAGPAQYTCDYQGISVGWADNYYNGLDCQWIDVTGLAEGTYELEVEVNPRFMITELDYTNNVTSVPVFIPADPNACLPAPDLCGDGQDQNCDGSIDDGCAAVSGNDTCAEAHLLEAGGVLRATLAGASADVTLCEGSGPDLAFTFEVLREEVVYLSTYGSSIDTVLGVFRESCTGAPIGCSDDGCGTQQSDFAEVLSPGRYYVVVKAFAAGATGAVQLKMVRSGCVGEHLGGAGTYIGTTAGGMDTMSMSCSPSNGPEDLRWFSTCPGGATPVQLDTCGTNYDTILEVRRDGCRGPVPLGACRDDSGGACGEGSRGSLIAVDLEANGAGDGLWFVIVDGYRAADAGPYTLTLSAP